MQLPRSPFRRLTCVAVLAFAAALAPATTLVAAVSRATPAGAVGPPACSTAGLVVWLDTQGNGTAGSVYYDLELTNLSGQTCTLSAFPGISAVNLAGHQLGSAARDTGSKKSAVVTLANGDTATAVVQIVDTGVFPPARCNQVHAAGLRVYPPDQYTSKVVPFPFLACSRSGPVYLIVQPVEKGVFGWS